jgi:P27 family predicted phage terminase small subunit
MAKTKNELRPTRKLTPEGERAWSRICNEMKSLGVLQPSFVEMITIAADAIGDIEIASADLIERGHISITERGETKNPSWTIKVSAQTIAHKYLTCLGLSPSTIGKLTGAKKDEANPFDEI